jgi:hypothetical protein
MSFPPPLSLHHYFVVAARMQHHFESNSGCGHFLKFRNGPEVALLRLKARTL